MRYKRHLKLAFAMLALFLTVIALSTIVIDPIFHFHKPLDGLNYFLGDTRYYNNGIAKHFDYDALITGSSMTRNFKPSEMDELWEVNGIILPYDGPSFKEASDNLKIAFNANDNIDMVIYSVDGNRIDDDKNHYVHDNIPFYLYDNNIFNDLEYIFNKEIILQNTAVVVYNTLKGIDDFSFDNYSLWEPGYATGYEGITASYARRTEKIDGQRELSEIEKETIYDNIEQNFFEIFKENPQTNFYLFFPPYSIAWFDESHMNGELVKDLEMYEYAASLFLQYDNVKLYSFFDNYDLITDFNNYRDRIHYLPDINKQLLEWMHAEEYLLTSENYKEHFSEISTFYINYDYDSLWLDEAVQA